MRILLMYSTHEPSPAHRQRLMAMQPEIEVVVARSEQEAVEQSPLAAIIFGHRYLRQCLPFAENLRWVQSTAGGVDRLPCDELARKGTILTNMTLAADTIARHAVTMAWSINRKIPDFWQQQIRGVWHQPSEWLPHPRRAIVFGMGSIGLAVAKILASDGIEVIGVKKTPIAPPLPPFTKVCDDDGSWFDELPHVDWCFLALPNTPETQNIFNKRVLSYLPAHAVLVNVGRGETLVTQDLCELLKQGHLGGAALDVVFPKPTDSQDLLWGTPRLYITPHVASHCHERASNIEKFCEQQLLRFIKNEPLSNLVKFTE